MPPTRRTTVPLAQVAREMGTTEKHIRKGIDNDEFPGIKVGDRYFVFEDAYEQVKRDEWVPKRFRLEGVAA